MKTVIGTYHVFGSGSATAYLTLDRVRVDGPVIDTQDNGFVGQLYADIPVTTLLAAKQVSFHESYTPGGSRTFSGSGRHFIKWYLGCQKAAPTPSLHTRLAQHRYNKRKQESDRLIAQAKETGRLVKRTTITGATQWLKKATVTLPDGCKGYKMIPVDLHEVGLGFAI